MYNTSLEEKIHTIRRIAETDYVQLEPYIRYIRFPLYKKLIPGTRIDFEFPFTVLVGPNGCNKSSILQALYGCPGNKSIGVYWFTTEVC